MQGQKITSTSAVLGRAFHIDLFIAGASPQALIVFFGGSGITEREYLSRSGTLIPVFDRELDLLEETYSFGFIFVTAPFDVPMRRFAEMPERAQMWNRHVLEEIFPA